MNSISKSKILLQTKKESQEEKTAQRVLLTWLNFVAITRIIWKNRLRDFAKPLMPRTKNLEKLLVITEPLIHRKLVIYGVCEKKVLVF